MIWMMDRVVTYFFSRLLVGGAVLMVGFIVVYVSLSLAVRMLALT